MFCGRRRRQHRIAEPRLGSGRRGTIAVKPTEDGGLTAAEKVFQVDLELPEDLPVSGVGQRAYVRFEHGAEPLADQWIRSGRQLLLSRLLYRQTATIDKSD